MLSLVHLVFPKYFNWKKELSALSLINRQMMYVHTFFIALVVFLTGLLCFTCAEELVSTDLGKKITLGLGIFWAARLYIQYGGYSTVLWKGKRLETTIHVLFTMLWTYLSILFLGNYFA